MLKLNPIQLDEKYLKEWNVNCNDFLVLCDENDNIINKSYYRQGGCNTIDFNKPYIRLLKYTEDLYDDSITKDPIKKKHLDGKWVIISTKTGEEKFKQQNGLDYINIIGVIYSYKDKFYDIETGYCYGKAYHSFKSKNFLFINTEFDDNKENRGVVKINIHDGNFELFI